MKALHLCAGVAFMALAACTTVGPNYKVPEAAAVKSPAAQGPFLGASTPAVSQAPVPDDWWKLYDDPVLNELVTTALTANTDIRVAAANLALAQGEVDETRAAQTHQRRRLRHAISASSSPARRFCSPRPSRC